MRMRQLLAAGAASALFALPGWADEKAGARISDSGKPALVDEGREDAMQKVGEARLKVLLWSVYDSRLYTPSGSYRDGDRPLRLEIQYLRDIKARALVDRTQVEWKAMGRSHPSQDSWLEELVSIWPDIVSNDVLTLELDSDNVATFRHNGRLLGQIADPEFGQQFVDIWLSTDSTRPELRLALIGRESAD